MKTSIISNQYNLQDAGRVNEWYGNRPARIKLETGMVLRLSAASGLYIPE